MPGSSPDVDKDLPAVEEAAVETKTTDVKDTSAESSPAEAKGEKGDMLSAVKAALKPEEKSPASEEMGLESDKDSAESATKEGAKAEAESEDFTEEELAQLQKLKPKTHKRITTLLEKQKGFIQELDSLRPQVEQFKKVLDFVEDAGLAPDEVNRGFDVMRNLKRFPLKAYEQIKPIFLQLQQMVGEILPEDLQVEVNFGRLTEAHARELAKTRTVASLSQRQVQENEARRQTEQEQQAFEGKRTAAAASVTEWEKSKSKSDPDWKLKQSNVTRLIKLGLYEKQQRDPSYFPTPAEAVAMAEDALKEVNADLKRFAPKPKAINTVPDASSTPGSKPKPKTAVEAAKQGLASMTAG